MNEYDKSDAIANAIINYYNEMEPNIKEMLNRVIDNYLDSTILDFTDNGIHPDPWWAS
jgi:hypothetical protein